MTQISLDIMWNTGKRLKICSKNLRSSNRRAISKHSLSFLTHTGGKSTKTHAFAHSCCSSCIERSVPAFLCACWLLSLYTCHTEIHPLECFKVFWRDSCRPVSTGEVSGDKAGLKDSQGASWPSPLHSVLHTIANWRDLRGSKIQGLISI